ncbi:hypothetical protein BDZ91DRAFT_742218 [Kalaharituber pfeilii]|nr:hypothetical protein BDZ91DRAFT_742218 [Kalaharituber pfeilii]
MNHVFYITNSGVLRSTCSVVSFWFGTQFQCRFFASPFAGIILPVKCYAWVL